MATVKKIFLSFIIIGAWFLLSTFWHFDNSDAFGHILTFLSIATGFVVTGLSIIATSNFSKELYKKEDSKDNSKTLLHILVNKFEKSTQLSVVTIILILLYYFLENWSGIKSYDFLETQISILSLLSGMIWLLTTLSIIYFLSLISTFGKFVIQTAKK